MAEQKAKILAVGHIINGKPEDWNFDCCGEVPALTVLPNGQILYAGYSIAELDKISKDFWGEGDSRAYTHRR